MEFERQGVLRYRCRVGHAWSPESLTSSQNITVEDALWTALRALEERSELERRIAERAARMAIIWLPSGSPGEPARRRSELRYSGIR